MENLSPIGRTAVEGSRRRARRNPEYEAERRRLAPYEEVARMLIRIRMDKGLTQVALAERVGMTAAAISRLESGQHAPTVETLRRVAEGLGGHLVIGVETSQGKGRQSSRRTLARVG